MSLYVNNLTLQSDEQALIQSLSITIEPGQCWFVYGCNGTGKTTLLRTLAGLNKHYIGTIRLNERALESYLPMELACHRAYLPQQAETVLNFSVEQLVFFARFAHMNGKMWAQPNDYAIVMDALKATGVDHLSKRAINTLSGGEQRRVALASIRAQDTPILLLDEPVAALDPYHQVQCMQRLSALCCQRSAIVVMHDFNLAWQVATHILLLEGNGKWQAGTYEHMMNEENLSRCFHTQVKKLTDKNRSVFMVS